MEKQKVTPYEVKGSINYDKLVKEFGVSPLKELPKVFNQELLFQRKIIFAHRDIQRILEAVKDRKKFVMMTGLMPSGKFHLGHAMIAKQMVFYQKLGAKIYIAVADIESFLTRSQSFEQSKKISEEYIKNYIALGLKPSNCEIYFQSNRSSNAEKANAFYRLQNLLAKYATFNEFKAIYGEITPGKMLASLLQAADMLHPQLPEFEGKNVPVIVPVGIDQDPHLRLARDISKRFKEYKFMQLSSTYNAFMPGLSGGKMSSSNPNSYIAMDDDAKTVANKINKYAFSGGQKTLEEHRKKGGNPDVDVSFQYLRMFFEPDDAKLANIEMSYRSGKLTTGELKKYTIKKINDFLKQHQKKLRQITQKDIDKFFD